MAWTSTPVAFSGTGKKGSLLIKPGDIYIGTLPDGSDAVKVGYTNQKIDFSITEEKKPCKQNGVKIAEARIGKEGKASFEFLEFDENVLATAMGMSHYLKDSVSGVSRVLIKATCETPVEIFLQIKTETFGGRDVRLTIPRGIVSISSAISIGASNDNPDWGKIAVDVEALAATVDGQEVLAYYEFDEVV